MFNKKDFIQEVLSEWALKIENGKPDPKDCFHIFLLREVLEDMNFSGDFINEFIGTLNIQQKNVCEYGYISGSATGSYYGYLHKPDEEDEEEETGEEMTPDGEMPTDDSEVTPPLPDGDGDEISSENLKELNGYDCVCKSEFRLKNPYM